MAEPKEITITVDDQTTQVAEGTTGNDLFAEEKTTVVMKVDGVLQDLFRVIPAGATVERVDITDQEGLEVLRHSTAHVLAQAVQELHPEAKLGIGPFIEDGFYYDFDVDEPFTPDDLKEIQKRMMRIVKAGQTFNRRAVDEAQAREELANEPYKLQLLDRQHDEEAAAEGAAVEIGAGEITIYDNLDRKGNVVWYDLCRGPHIPSTKLIANGFSLTRAAGAYWLGSENNPQLQRIYGTAWASKDDLVAYQERIAEAERRDHRKLGAEMDLFSFPDKLGSGLPVFHPKGGIIRKEMEDYSRRRHEEAGYEFVYTPHITKQNLYETSGHLEWYADGMFPPMHIDEIRDEETGEVTRAGADYYLKPMNCPMHNLIFASRGRSYRELPLRMFEFGSVYRYEKSGVVHGLTRVRGMTQDDAHIYCTEDQMKDELTNTLNFILDLLKDYGLDDFYLELSTRDPEKYVGSEEVWDNATRVLAEVAEESKLELVDDPGGAAFYGPKISVQARDALGRTWQMSTIQLDFNLPERFDLEYQAADGTRQRPVMIHRALFGSIERFMGVLTEHYAGAFPAWLAPEQVIAIPVAEAFNDYLFDIVDRLKARGIRARVDDSTDRFPKKIRTAAKHKAPFVLIAGGEDAEANAVSFRFRDGSQDNGVPVDEAIERIVSAVEQRQQV
ncbi:MAG TPA: threonine--tRNA ligase [Enteractinococcus helveticum]|uniref:Threonine--tRNA ligase n=1 Tax=Enteractinococcus helveticum TaxID=1837282 RepID=A0A921FME0_9MICC|nr:threonine--tRNA ligase [Enteractinococcus helveticum]HJF14309.1 threonine--tRNA ligase [Enteractinococcus helveticum]